LWDRPIVRIVWPENHAVLSGEIRLDVAVEASLTPLESVVVDVDGQQIYRGVDQSMDTRKWGDGHHKVTVTATDKNGKMVSDSVACMVDNWWHFEDEFLPPKKTSLFGVVDRCKTTEQSDGWLYKTDQAEFFGDDSRIVRRDSSQQYLVWETPRLEECSLIAYVTNREYIGDISLEASLDGQKWVRIKHEIHADELRHDCLKVELKGSLAPNTNVGYFRIVLADSEILPDSIQLGRIRLTGSK
ncbi:MAG: hypothetical protein PHH90_08210, partial [Limnochordia bacterium]|nr:hypothetical protein [Limnochordia bacterium]